jgi:hypothetical protein
MLLLPWRQHPAELLPFYELPIKIIDIVKYAESLSPAAKIKVHALTSRQGARDRRRGGLSSKRFMGPLGPPQM